MVDVDGIRAGLMFFGIFYGGLLLEYAVYCLYKWLRCPEAIRDALIRKAETAILKEVAENERTRS